MIWLPLSGWKDLPASAGIYVIRNRVNGKEYVGMSIDLRLRGRMHAAAKGKQRLYRAIKEYGLAEFEIAVLHAGCDNLCEMEVKTIAERGTYGTGGYNDTRGGEGGWKGKQHTLESRRKMSEAQLRNGAFRGKTHSAETRKRISEANLGRRLSPESIERFRAAQIGKKATPETLQRMREARPGKAVLAWPPNSTVPVELPSIHAAALWAGVSTTAIQLRLKSGRPSAMLGAWAYVSDL
jgi:group I intron endonuclease